ncbi:hypothetical protein [Niallia sp. 01092]|uniref:hypothetical protein n=1 Tax=unclassified Niallia TaxID=2837522 RepID=UPI003FD31EDC
MKPYQYIFLVLICLAVIIVTVIRINEKNQNLETISDSKQTEEKKELSQVKEKALYEWNIREGNEEYEAYLVGEEEKQYTLKENNTFGKVDDPIIEGDFSFYLANEKNGPFAFKQAAGMKEPFVFNLMNKNKSTYYVNKHTIAAIFQQAAKDETKAYLYTIKNGELSFLTNEAVPIYDNKIKNIQQNYLQTINKIDEKTFEFTTWTLDPKQLKLEPLDVTSVQEKGIVENWLMDEMYYYPFKNLAITSSVIRKASEGMLIGSQYPIGTNSNEIKTSNEHFIKEEVKKDVITLVFPEVTYYYNKKNEQVSAISIPGIRLKGTLENVKEMLGEPDAYFVNKKKNEAVAIYHAGNYELKILVNNAQIIQTLELSKR